jgi:ATP-dependent DNA helicase RecG
MNASDLNDLIRNGEGSGVELKRDDVRPERLAKELAALLNLEGGCVLLGVEADGRISGLTRTPEQAEEWAMEVARTHLRPAAIPFWQIIRLDDGKVVGVLKLPDDAPDKPYKAKRGSVWVTQVRVGTTTRDATDDEEARLYMQSGRLQYDRRPVPGAGLDTLDLRRLRNYFRDVRRQDCPEPDDPAAWQRLLLNTEMLVEDRDRLMPSVAALLLFGTAPKRFLPQSGITAVAYPGSEKDYDAKAGPRTLKGPALPLFRAATDPEVPGFPRPPNSFSAPDQAIEPGVIAEALDFVRRNTEVSAWIDAGGIRRERWDYPLEAVREALVNAVAHRDYSITVIDIELALYSDRLEVTSPGRLPNTVTVEKMRAGYRATRNELIKEVLRDYRLIEATGLGIPRKIIAGMRAHNGTEPELIEDADRFRVRLWKNPRATRASTPTTPVDPPKVT